MRATLRGPDLARFLKHVRLYQQRYDLRSARSLSSRLGVSRHSVKKWFSGRPTQSATALRAATSIICDYESDLESGRAVLCPDSSFDVIQEALLPAMTHTEATAIAMYSATMASDWLSDALGAEFSVPTVVRLPAKETGARIDLGQSFPALGWDRNIRVYVFCRAGRITYHLKAWGHPRRQLEETGVLTDKAWASRCEEILSYVQREKNDK